jgi:uncharacterized repeat protein (TIGR03803 family)
VNTSQASRLLSFTPAPIAVFLILFCAAATNSLSAQTFTSLVSFNFTNGASPYQSSVVQGRDGNLYGTTSLGGANNGCCGTFFRYNPVTNTLTVLYSFCALSCADGANPQGGVVLGTNGNFYGTTASTVFEITPAGTLTTLHVFSGADGADPQGPLFQASNGNFYGTTRFGGANSDGTVFAMTPAGTLATLHSFSGIDGANPQSGVIQAANGGFYGTTPFGGANSSGTAFQMTPSGTVTTIHSFNGFDAASPNGLVQAADGNLYGTTLDGGTSTACAPWTCGTVFKMTLKGTLTILQSFDDGINGAWPSAGLIQGSDKNLYGSAAVGGLSGFPCPFGIPGCGTIFQITSAGTLFSLHSFDSTDGSYPYASLLQATSGIFYGTTLDGGDPSCYCGTVFSLNTGLGPFVQALRYSRKVGNTIEFLGQGFTKSSTVSFNGTLATPTGGSSTFLTVKVPSGATTGLVTITTSKGSLQSNKIFRVIP